MQSKWFGRFLIAIICFKKWFDLKMIAIKMIWTIFDCKHLFQKMIWFKNDCNQNDLEDFWLQSNNQSIKWFHLIMISIITNWRIFSAFRMNDSKLIYNPFFNFNGVGLVQFSPVDNYICQRRNPYKFIEICTKYFGVGN